MEGIRMVTMETTTTMAEATTTTTAIRTATIPTGNLNHLLLSRTLPCLHSNQDTITKTTWTLSDTMTTIATIQMVEATLAETHIREIQTIAETLAVATPATT